MHQANAMLKKHVKMVVAALLTCAAHAGPVMAVHDVQQGLCCCRLLGIDGYREQVRIPSWVVIHDAKQVSLLIVLSTAESAADVHAMHGMMTSTAHLCACSSVQVYTA
jgi:hypothetical protein